MVGAEFSAALCTLEQNSVLQIINSSKYQSFIGLFNNYTFGRNELENILAICGLHKINIPASENTYRFCFHKTCFRKEKKKTYFQGLPLILMFSFLEFLSSV